MSIANDAPSARHKPVRAAVLDRGGVPGDQTLCVGGGMTSPTDSRAVTAKQRTKTQTAHTENAERRGVQ